MENPNSDGGIRRKRLSKNRQLVPIMQCPPQPPPKLPMVIRTPPPNQAKLAAIAVDMNVRLRSADMPAAMQERAFRCTRPVLQKNLNPTHIAMSLKKEFDGVYGPAWHCIVGKSFGSFVTHSSGGFVYFSVDKLCFLLFKTEVRPVNKLPLLLNL